MMRAQGLGVAVLVVLLASPSSGCVLSHLHETGREPYSPQSTALEDVGATVEYAGLALGCAAALVGLVWLASRADEQPEICRLNPTLPECGDD